MKRSWAVLALSMAVLIPPAQAQDADYETAISCGVVFEIYAEGYAAKVAAKLAESLGTDRATVEGDWNYEFMYWLFETDETSEQKLDLCLETFETGPAT